MNELDPAKSICISESVQLDGVSDSYDYRSLSLRPQMFIPLLVLVLGCALTVTIRADVPEELRVDDVSYHTKEIYRRDDFFHVQYLPAGQTPTEAAKSLDFFRQALSTDRLDQVIETHLQTLDRRTPKGFLTVIEKSERHLVLKDVRFDGTLKGSPFFIIYCYELSGRTLLSSQFIFRPLPPFNTPESFAKEFTEKESRWLKDLRKASPAVQDSLAEEVNKSGAANGSQPIRSESMVPPSDGSGR